MTQIEVVVFANSIKHGQHCVAGKCVNTGKWIRPVSNQQGAELSHEQAKYQNPYGIYGVKPLQKIKMGFSHHVPLLHQPENFLIDGNRWKQNYSIGIADLSNYVDEPTDLWQGESVNILLNFTQFFETRIEYRFQIFTAHSCDFLLPSYARLA
ncbi:dual OB domain-containing protein [Aeromonas caviae]|uniref:dual OB domain-containing protein n=1 Tax=Aeromonas caviae TaxID=648 RepID=UPI0021FD5BB1|nr:hypothetical protein KAM479c_26330 [Aeromonas caviae]